MIIIMEIYAGATYNGRDFTQMLTTILRSGKPHS